MSRKILIGIIVLTVFNIGLLAFLIYIQQATKGQNPLDSRVVKLQSIMQKQFEIEGKSFVMYGSIADSLRNCTKDKTVLILRFGKHSCSSCIDNAIADLLSFKDSIGSQNVLILFTAEDKKDIVLLKNQYFIYQRRGHNFRGNTGKFTSPFFCGFLN